LGKNGVKKPATEDHEKGEGHTGEPDVKRNPRRKWLRKSGSDTSLELCAGLPDERLMVIVYRGFAVASTSRAGMLASKFISVSGTIIVISGPSNSDDGERKGECMLWSNGAGWRVEKTSSLSRFGSSTRRSLSSLYHDPSKPLH
jgi:hypothetical protein